MAEAVRVTDDIVAFVRSRLAEHAENAESVHYFGCGEIKYDGTCNCGWPELLARDIEVKRLAVDEYEMARKAEMLWWDKYLASRLRSDGDEAKRRMEIADRQELVVRYLAAAFRDHADYQAEWMFGLPTRWVGGQSGGGHFVLAVGPDTTTA